MIVLGVSGGIAAYKSCSLLRFLTEAGHDVQVVPTATALRFVGAPTWEALSGHPVSTDPTERAWEVPHVAIGRAAELIIIAPATANLLAKIAHGLADDLLTNTVLTATCPVVIAPAMHTEMWENPATVANVATLRERGMLVVEPAVGRLTGADSGPGRLPEPQGLAEIVFSILSRGQRARERDLVGLNVVVTAGGTREFWDPVRFIGNRSSGLQGYALAQAAIVRGACVTLIAANTTLPDLAGVQIVRVESTEELAKAVQSHVATADVVVMAAAPADFRPAERLYDKLKRDPAGDGMTLQLEQNPDILAELGRHRSDAQTVVGFAAETGSATERLELARQKLARKGCDLLVLNDVGGGAVFGAEENEVTILGADGSSISVPRRSKREVAEAIWDRVLAFREGKGLDRH